MDAASREIIESALRLLEHACESWRALAQQWDRAGNADKAEDARDELQLCAERRKCALSILREMDLSRRTRR